MERFTLSFTFRADTEDAKAIFRKVKAIMRDPESGAQRGLSGSLRRELERPALLPLVSFIEPDLPEIDGPSTGAQC